MSRPTTWGRAALLLALPLASACEDLGFGPGDGAPVSISFAVPRPGASPSTASLASLEPISDGTHSLDITSIEVTFSEVVLERAEGGLGGDSDGDSESDSDSDGAGNEKFRSGPVTVPLPLSGGVITPISDPLPEGLYEELEMDVKEVRVRGTFDGESFDLLLPLDAELETEFDPPFEVTAEEGQLNITVSVDALRWFRASDGSLIDPRAIQGNEDLRERLIRRIEDSFDAFEDSDADADESDSDSDSDSG